MDPNNGARESWRIVLTAFIAVVLIAGCRSTSDSSEAMGEGATDSATAQDGTARNGGADRSNGEAGSGDAMADESTQSGGDGGDILDRVRQDEGRRAEEGRFLFRQAEKNFEEGQYRKAEELYRRALEANPEIDEAKRKRALALMFLGNRDGEIRSMLEGIVSEKRVLDQQRLAEVRRLVDQHDRALAEDDVERAFRAITRARENLFYFDYGVDTSDLEDEVFRKFESTRLQRKALEEQLARDIQESARDRAVAEQEKVEEERQKRLDMLFTRAEESYRLRDYEIAISTAEEILELEPNLVEAQKLLKRSKESLRVKRRIDILELREDERNRIDESFLEAAIPYDEPFEFPDEDVWRGEVKQRAARTVDIRFEDPYEVQQIKRQLNQPAPALSFSGEPLADVVNFIRQISNVNITIDPEVDAEEQTVNLRVENVRLGEALELILENTGLAYSYRYNTLFITTPDNAYGNTVFHIYTVSDLLNKIRDFPGPSIRVRTNDETDDGSSPFSFADEAEDDVEPLNIDDLVDSLYSSTGGEDLWDEAKSRITAAKGQLLVTATPELHIALQRFLENLRKDSDLFVIVEARFIDLFDDFLEDIGIDSRNLGQPPGTGFGTAYGLLNSGRTGGLDPGFNNLGNPTNPSLLQGLDRFAGRLQNIIDGFVGPVEGTRLTAASRGLTFQATWLDPFQINAILRASAERRQAQTITAPRVTASNGQRVHVSVITQQSYVQDYELVSGGTGLVVSEVADPVVATFQDGVILDVRPVISHDRRYVTLDVRPTLATLVNGIISTVTVSLGSLVQAATLVDIDLPEIALQQAFTSVTVPDGGTVLLGGFRSLNEQKYQSFVPIVGRLPLVKNLLRRKAYLSEKRSLYILLTAKVVDLRAEERDLFN